MSLIIKGVDMPTSCEDCYLRKAAANYAGWGPFDVCPMIDTDISRERKNNCRCEDCPLVEIPTPHGRLIDADELKKKLEKHREMCGDIELAHGIDEAIRILENATIIIKAEVSE